ncbi:unnamed protein product [Nezara viridula]|uniref:Uncharacterized protein n=1 Tax=Nezara viridula TaxID=85310 RepID=A0A9P0MNS4_NEZVI|nr:unnamed protein product [Nezara viridula]
MDRKRGIFLVPPPPLAVVVEDMAQKIHCKEERVRGKKRSTAHIPRGSQEKRRSTKKTKKEEDEEDKEEKDDKDRLNGVSYTVDLETGEYIVKEETDRRDDLGEDEPPSSLLPEPEFSLEEALQLFLEGEGIEREESEASVSESSGSPSRLTEELDLLEEMIHGPAYPPPHHRPIQGTGQGSIRRYKRHLLYTALRLRSLSPLLGCMPPRDPVNFPH